METILIKTLQLLCCFSLLVVLHEGGHFGFAKLFGVRVEKFYMFFDYKFHLFSTKSRWFARLFPRLAKSGTEYGVGWIPLGGYVKIAGMIDESMDTGQMKEPARPDEFRSQKVWKRFLIMFGGVLMNLLTAWALYSAVMLTWGRDYVPMRGVTGGFQFSESALALGFRDGDIPVAADGEEIAEYSQSVYRTLSNASTVTVLRGGREVTLTLPEGGLNMLEMLRMSPPFMAPLAPALVDSVAPGSPAALAGVRPGSRLLAAGGRPVRTWGDYDAAVSLPREAALSAPGCTRADSLARRRLTIVFRAPGAARPDTATLALGCDYLMGLTRRPPRYTVAHASYGLLSCVPAGLRHGWTVLSGYVNDLKYLASADGAASVGSFITIGNIFPSAWDWQQFWMLTALVSIMLAVMNILPIPGLDGGHIAFLLYEAVTGRQPSDRVAEWFERVGLTLIVLLMLLALSNDFRHFILPIFGL